MEVDDSVDQCAKDTIHDHCKLYVFCMCLREVHLMRIASKVSLTNLLPRTFCFTVHNLTRHLEMKAGTKVRERQITFCRRTVLEISSVLKPFLVVCLDKMCGCRVDYLFANRGYYFWS
jgi:hypothetical protein